MYCDEPVLDGEQDPDRPAIHYECGARAAVGSVGHLLGTCSCKGGTYEDPPGLSKREAAKLAFMVFDRLTSLPSAGDQSRRELGEYVYDTWIRANTYALALIEIATLFERTFCPPPAYDTCGHCHKPLAFQCEPDCPGLAARRALGIA
jgi:hypothetical protein